MMGYGKVLPIIIVGFLAVDASLWLMDEGTGSNGAFVCGGDDRKDIMNALQDHPEGLTAGEVEDLTGYQRIRVDSELECLEDAGKIRVRDPGVLETSIYISNRADEDE